jgi:hypothetical protein
MPVLNTADKLNLGSVTVDAAYLGTTKVWSAAYLTPTVGTVTTPDPGPLPPQHVVVWKATGPLNSTPINQHIAAQFDADPQRSYSFQRNRSGYVRTLFSGDGLAAGATAHARTAPNITGIETKISYLAIAVDLTVQRLTCYTSPDGVTWTQFNSGTTPVLTPFDSSGVLRIGGYAPTGVERWNGRIYWVEMRTGVDPAAGVVQWRFDPNDWHTGTTFTDPRGRTWTLATAGAITR